MKHVEAQAIQAQLFCAKQPNLSPYLASKGITLRKAGAPIRGARMAKPEPGTTFCTWKLKSHGEQLKRLVSGCNFLASENGLLNQKAGFFVSRTGWFKDSHLANPDHPIPTRTELERLQRFTKEWFGWELGRGAPVNGPVLIVLQNNTDTSVQFGFAHKGYQTATHKLLDLCREHLPQDAQVLVRPHPRFLQRFMNEERRHRYRRLYGAKWSLDTSKSIYELIPHCSALVTICSTVATEACTSGIPVFALGEGPFSDTGAVFEGEICLANYGKMMNAGVDLGKRLAYVNRVFKDQLPMNASAEQMEDNEPIREWAEQCLKLSSLVSEPKSRKSTGVMRRNCARTVPRSA